ncbi:hypothetical protein [Aquibaculum arenosum]|uniref:Antifreeze glycopeptide polyprotein n=1 Tax=Aquibaculum arenosum TaxID=3032591 RepID=A0ABT5YHX1_9PROT|nr:hypothetical protein [Fodinicurvata sp. CAU 1616]MDF2094532.1 hypothetical protein [Fodinicurvata sp. CAU 1616]
MRAWTTDGRGAGRAAGLGRLALLTAGALVLLTLPPQAEAQTSSYATGQPRQLFPQDDSASGSGGAGVRGRDVQEPSGSGFPRAPDPYEQPGDYFEAAPAPGSEPARTGLVQPPALDRPQADPGDGTYVIRGGIEVDPLSSGIPETAGTLDPGDGGLGYDLWQGSDREEIVRLIRTLPSLQSPALRDSAVRLLLSSAAPPRSHSALGGSGDLLEARAEALANLGAQEELLELLRRLPRDAEQNQRLARLHVEAALLTRSRAEACRVTRGAIERFSDTAFWQEALIYCQISEGEEAAASLGLSLLRELDEGDPQRIALAEAALGRGQPPEPREADGLTLAYLAALDAAPAPALLQTSDARILAAVSRLSAVPAEERLRLTERAVGRDLLPARSLAEAYERARFSGAELDDPRGAAAGLEPTLARALLYKGAWRSHDPQEKLALLQAYVDAAAGEGLTLAALKAAGGLLLGVNPGMELREDAALAAKALIVSGRLERAAAWISLLRSAAGSSDAARRAYAEIWPLARVAGLETDAVLDIDGWRRIVQGNGDPLRGEEMQSQLRGMIAALDGRGDEDAPRMVSRVGGLGPPSASGLYGLRGAATDGFRGETLLQALHLLGEGPLDEVHPQALTEVLDALTRVDLSTEARAIAIETLLVQDY